MPDYDYKQIIVLRKDLNMRKGKMVAQGAHASMAAIITKEECGNTVIIHDWNVQDWLSGRFAKICVGVDSEQELLDLHQKALDANIPTSLIQDSGFTEFNNVPTYTAVAIGPATHEKLEPITGNLKLI